MKHTNCMKIMGILSILFLLVSCGGGGGGGASSVGTSIIEITIGGSGATAKVESSENTLFAKVKEFFNIFTPEEAVAQFLIEPFPNGPSEICGIPPEVDRIVFNISGSGISIPPRTAQVNHDGIHECEVTERFEIPDGTGIIFTADALTVGGQRVYSGIETANVPAPNNLVEIPMERECNLYVDDNRDIAWDYVISYDYEVNNTDKNVEEFKFANLTKYFVNLITPHAAIAGTPQAPIVDSVNDCRDPEQPCHSITHAIDQASTGETICVLPGWYIPDYSSNCDEFSFPSEGDDECYPLNVNKDITLLCIGADRSCILEGNSYDSDRPIADTGVLINGTSEIHNFTIQHFPPFFAPPLCDNCDTGIKVMSGTPTISGNLMHNNVIGIAITAGSPNIVGNWIIDNGVGMRLLSAAENPVITGNTIACNFQSDLFLAETGGLINLSNNTWDEPELEVILNGESECLKPDNLGVDVCYEGSIAPDTSGAKFTECLLAAAS